EDVPVGLRVFQEVRRRLPGARGLAQASDEDLLVELRDQHAQIILILAAAAEEFAQEDVVNVHQVNLQLAERFERVNAPVPAAGQVVRLKMGQVKTEILFQFVQEPVLRTDLRRDLVHDVNVFGV